MKAKYTFEIMDLDNGQVAVPVGNNAEQFHGVLKINETAGDILDLLGQDITEAEIVEKLLQKYEGEKLELAGHVHEFIEKLIAEGIVE